MKRINLFLEDELHKEFKKECLEQKCSMQHTIVQLIEEALGKRVPSLTGKVYLSPTKPYPIIPPEENV